MSSMHFNVYSGAMGSTPEKIIHAAGLATCGDPSFWDVDDIDGLQRLDGIMPNEPPAQEPKPPQAAFR